MGIMQGCLGERRIRMKKNNVANARLTGNAKKLRGNMTKEERRLWHEFLKGLPITVHRQKVIKKYIADFYCAAADIVIELDGSQHYETDGIASDAERDAFFAEKGIKVLRYSNSEINTKFESVCESILQEIKKRIS